MFIVRSISYSECFLTSMVVNISHHQIFVISSLAFGEFFIILLLFVFSKISFDTLPLIFIELFSRVYMEMQFHLLRPSDSSSVFITNGIFLWLHTFFWKLK